MKALDTCKFCHYEENGYKEDKWDILKLNDDEEWSHIQIHNRLHLKGIESLFVDIWGNDNLAILIGCNESVDKVADALNIHRECIYNDAEHQMLILNLLEEKVIRMMENDVEGYVTIMNLKKELGYEV